MIQSFPWTTSNCNPFLFLIDVTVQNLEGEPVTMTFSHPAPVLLRSKLDVFQWSYPNTALIQDAFSELTDDEREFLMTGMTPEQWDETFPEENTDVA